MSTACGVSGVNLVWNLGNRGSGSTKFRFFHANYRKISIFSGNFYKFRFSRQKMLIYSYFWEIILFLFRSHHFRTYFL